MKVFVTIFIAGCVIAAVRAADSSALDVNELSKKAADFMAEWSKKIQESTGLKTDFDKEKFLKVVKEQNEKAAVLVKSWKESWDQNAKNLPNSEEVKKKIDEFSKQFQETLKSVNSQDVQKSADKLKDIVTNGVKKSAEAFTEVLQKVGAAPPANVQKSLTEMFDEMVKLSNVVQEKMVKVVEDAQSELKKKKL